MNCIYSGHNEKEVKVTRPDGKYYNVPITPEIYKKGILEFIQPIEKSLTISYWRDKKTDELLNIKRDISTHVEGFWFYYDSIDGIIEIYDIMLRDNSSVYRNIQGLFNLSDEKTYKKIIDEIEKQEKIIVKELKYLPLKYDKLSLPYN